MPRKSAGRQRSGQGPSGPDDGHDSDEVLMAAYASDDARAFEQLFDRYAGRIHGFFVRCLGSRTLADDLLQATLLKLHVARHSYRVGAPFRPWLYTITARVRLDELRRQGRLPVSATEAELDEAAGADSASAALSNSSLNVVPLASEEWLAGEELAKQVRSALDALPESQRIVLFLHRFEGLTFEEIGQILDVAPGSVRARAFRAYATLRETLKRLAREGV